MTYVHIHTVIALYNNPTDTFATFSTVRCLEKEGVVAGRGWTRLGRLRIGKLVVCGSHVNLLTPNVNYSGRTAPPTSKVTFYIFIQQI